MKWGPLEGTREEINGFIEDNGLQVEAYFQAYEQPIRNRWFGLPSAAMIASMGVLAFVPSSSTNLRNFTFLLGCSSAVWLASIVQLRFKNAVAATGIAVAALLLLLVALGVLRPTDLLDIVQKWKGK